MCEFQKQYNFYLANENMLLSQYQGKYLVISDGLQVKAYDDKREAYEAGAEEYGLGHFMLQLCDYEAFHTVHFVNMRLTI